MNKQITVDQGIHAAHLYREAGIEVAAFFIVGYPGETVASIEETFELALSAAARRHLLQRAGAAARVAPVRAAGRSG